MDINLKNRLRVPFNSNSPSDDVLSLDPQSIINHTPRQPTPSASTPPSYLNNSSRRLTSTPVNSLPIPNPFNVNSSTLPPLLHPSFDPLPNSPVVPATPNAASNAASINHLVTPLTHLRPSSPRTPTNVNLPDYHKPNYNSPHVPMPTPNVAYAPHPSYPTYNPYHQTPYFPQSPYNYSFQPTNQNNKLNPTPFSSASPREFDHKRLPKLELPTFSGNHESFFPFWDTFANLVHDDPLLPPKLKFQYLRTCLKGEALTTIEGFAITSDNYASAVKLLHSIYASPDKLQRQLFRELGKFEPPTHDPDSLRKFKLKFVSLTRRFQEVVSYQPLNVLLRNTLNNLLPTLTKQEILKWSRNEALSLEDFLNGIDFVIALLSVDHSSNKPPATESTCLTPKKINIPRTCRFCAENHKTTVCPNYLTPDSRLARINKLKLCIKCLSDTHTSVRCRTEVRCHICSSSRHLTPMCHKRKL